LPDELIHLFQHDQGLAYTTMDCDAQSPTFCKV